MTRFLSSRLDLSRLQAIKPALILDLDYEAIRSARLADLQTRLPDVDVLSLLADPAVALQEADAYRELLDKALLNDTVRGLLPAFAQGTDLDHIAARSAVYRLQVGTAANGDPIMEDDDTLRLRYFASFGVPAAGSEDGYVFHALSAYPSAWDIAVVGPAIHGERGRVDVVVLAPGGSAPSSDDLEAIRTALTADNARPMTDWVVVMPAVLVPYTVNMTVRIKPGPAPSAVHDDVVSRLQTITLDRSRVGGQVPRSALTAAGYPIAAETLISSPPADIPADPYKTPWCTGITVQVQEIDG